MKNFTPRKGRGTSVNPTNRFDTVASISTQDEQTRLPEFPKTIFHFDTTKSLITYNDSPDIGMSAGINPYRGCEHGCVYCFARPTHEYLGMSSGLDFETRIFVKKKAPQILRQELMAKGYTPQVIGLSGNTDPYQPAERHFKLTRGCLRVLADFRHPVGIITKNRLVVRDIDLLRELHAHQAIKVYISITTLRKDLASRLEPRASTPMDRLRTVRELREAHIPVGVMVAPVIPGLTDEEIPAILESSAEAGALTARYIMLRLPHSVKDLFVHWLQENYPLAKQKVLQRIRSVRNGRLNDSSFHERLRGTGIHAKQIHKIFTVYSRRFRLMDNLEPLSTDKFQKPNSQLMLFESEL